jgi:hypothetical protein
LRDFQGVRLRFRQPLKRHERVRIKPSTLTHSLVFTSATEGFGTAEKTKLKDQLLTL